MKVVFCFRYLIFIKNLINLHDKIKNKKIYYQNISLSGLTSVLPHSPGPKEMSIISSLYIFQKIYCLHIYMYVYNIQLYKIYLIVYCVYSFCHLAFFQIKFYLEVYSTIIYSQLHSIIRETGPHWAFPGIGLPPYLLLQLLPEVPR